MGKVALVTGANQGLGLALVKGLCSALGPDDTVYLTARDAQKGEAALYRPLAAQVRHVVNTNNHGTARMLGAFLPLLNRGARFVTVASSFGSLVHLAPHLHRHFDVQTAALEDIEAVMDDYVEAVEDGSAVSQGWPDWINIPSKVGQVAATKIAARIVRASRPDDGILINAVCPGLIDTGASRPWFSDMSVAQTPDQAAVDVLWLALLPAGTQTPHGQLVQFRKILDWR